jgi:hypothetical protein
MPPSSVDALDDMTAPADYWVVSLPGLRTQSEMNLREHWGKRNARRERQQRVTLCALRSQIGNRPPPCPLVAKLTRVGPRRMDSDNAVISLKHVRDAVAKYLGVDDGDEASVRWEYGQEVAKTYAVRVEIRRAP